MNVAAPRLFAPARELTPRLGSRDLFGGLDPLVYANHAGISPPSVVVRKAVATLLTDYGKRGAAAYPTWSAQRERLRAKLSDLVGAASPRDIALTQNTSRGISDVALCLPWKRGDRVVLFRGEFPANVIPWQRAAELFDLDVVLLDGSRWLHDEAGALEDLGGALAQGARLVAISAVQFQTGLRLPIAQISRLVHTAGAQLFVDAVQACGIVPIDVRAEGIDYLACGAHKWLMGTEGAGFLYAAEATAAQLVPRVASWLSVAPATDFLFEGAGKLTCDKPIRRTVDLVEGGNLAAMAFAALEAALDLILELGVKDVFEHVQRVNDAIEVGATALGFVSLRSVDTDRRSGSLVLDPPAGIDVLAVHAELTRLNVACATPDGHLRLSPHWPNAVDEADQVVLSLEHALAALSP